MFIKKTSSKIHMINIINYINSSIYILNKDKLNIFVL